MLGNTRYNMESKQKARETIAILLLIVRYNYTGAALEG